VPTLLGPAQFEEVRAAIAPELVDDKGVLPDEVIGQDLYAGEAIRELQALDPLWATREGDEFRRVQTATVLLCAARLAPKMAEVTSESIGPYSIKTEPRDLAALSGALHYQALQLLSANVPTIDPLEAYRPTSFALAPGGRGDVSRQSNSLASLI
jgi:hypothetical protein